MVCQQTILLTRNNNLLLSILMMLFGTNRAKSANIRKKVFVIGLMKRMKKFDALTQSQIFSKKIVTKKNAVNIFTL